jgi:cysteine sulfinate desulfinase/cysteine desulfurase-like protein
MNELDYGKQADTLIDEARRTNRLLLQRQEGKTIVFDESEPEFVFTVITENNTSRLAVF